MAISQSLRSLPPLKLLISNYRKLKWHYLNFKSRGKIDETTHIDPQAIEFGQTPESQFPPMHFLGGYRDGDWDKQLIPVVSHPLYQSYVQHFVSGEPWENTPFFQFAQSIISQGKAFRGEYDDIESLHKRFAKCDRLYAAIADEGYRSNHQLYEEGKLDNILELMDEVTVNIARDGSIILNDGWHRFATARMLKITTMPVRVCARHALLAEP